MAFVYRDSPTSEQATRGAVAARCVPEEHFYEFVEMLFHNLKHWYPAKDVDAALVRLADDQPYPTNDVAACLRDPENTERVKESQRYGDDTYGVDGTPVFIINGEVVRGLRKLDVMEAFIDEALAKAAGASTDERRSQ